MADALRRSSAAYGRVGGTDAEALIQAHLPLVRKIAWHTQGRIGSAFEIADLIQIGTVALIECAQSFEDRGLPFGSYATMRIRGAMIDAYRRVAGISRGNLVKRRAFKAARAKLEATFGRAPSQQEMADAVGLDLSAFRAASDEMVGMTIEALDEVYDDRSMAFVSEEPAADADFDRTRVAELLADAIAGLPDREALVLQLFFHEEMNLDEIGSALNITGARVCQLKKAALDKLRIAMPVALDELL